MRDDRYYFYTSRTICEVLEEMRKCNETRNYAPMLSLIEEAQSMSNRMENAIGDKHEVIKREKYLAKLKKKIKKKDNGKNNIS